MSNNAFGVVKPTNLMGSQLGGIVGHIGVGLGRD